MRDLEQENSSLYHSAREQRELVAACDVALRARDAKIIDLEGQNTALGEIVAAFDSELESKDRLLQNHKTTFRSAIAILEEKVQRAEARAAHAEAEGGRRDEVVRKFPDEMRARDAKIVHLERQVAKLERDNEVVEINLRATVEAHRFEVYELHNAYARELEQLRQRHQAERTRATQLDNERSDQ
uniref:Uncharacterized protein n=5 Tax=Chrysotila carterae TaxID=13221 RepID=A0A7S4F1P4_CHRCT